MSRKKELIKIFNRNKVIKNNFQTLIDTSKNDEEYENELFLNTDKYTIELTENFDIEDVKLSFNIIKEIEGKNSDELGVSDVAELFGFSPFKYKSLINKLNNHENNKSNKSSNDSNG